MLDPIFTCDYQAISHINNEPVLGGISSASNLMAITNVRNAYPTSNSYTITGFDGGVRYKVKVRARFDEGGPGDWAEPVETDVASSS